LPIELFVRNGHFQTGGIKMKKLLSLLIALLMLLATPLTNFAESFDLGDNLVVEKQEKRDKAY